jgi:hypothetical protein
MDDLLAPFSIVETENDLLGVALSEMDSYLSTMNILNNAEMGTPSESSDGRSRHHR